MRILVIFSLLSLSCSGQITFKSDSIHLDLDSLKTVVETSVFDDNDIIGKYTLAQYRYQHYEDHSHIQGWIAMYTESRANYHYTFFKNHTYEIRAGVKGASVNSFGDWWIKDSILYMTSNLWPDDEPMDQNVAIDGNEMHWIDLFPDGSAQIRIFVPRED